VNIDRLYAEPMVAAVADRIQRCRVSDLTAIILVIVSSVAHDTSVCHSHIKRASNAEGQYGIPWNPNSSSSRLATLNRSYDRTYQAIVVL